MKNRREITWHNPVDKYLFDLQGSFNIYTKLSKNVVRKKTLDINKLLNEFNIRWNTTHLFENESKKSTNLSWSNNQSIDDQLKQAADIVAITAAEIRKTIACKLLVELASKHVKAEVRAQQAAIFDPCTGSGMIPILPDASPYPWNQVQAHELNHCFLIDDPESCLHSVVPAIRPKPKFIDDTAFIRQVSIIAYRKLRNLIRSIRKILRHSMSRDRRELIRALVPSMRIHNRDGKESEDSNFSYTKEKLFLTFTNPSITWTHLKKISYGEHNMALAS